MLRHHSGGVAGSSAAQAQSCTQTSHIRSAARPPLRLSSLETVEFRVLKRRLRQHERRRYLAHAAGFSLDGIHACGKMRFFPKLLIMSNALWDALPLGPYNIPEHSVPKVGVSMFFVMRLVHGTLFTFLIDSSAKYDL